jgi:hypothetical protein
VVVLACFAIVCTGRMPGRLGDYLMGVLRYGWRVGAFLFGLTDRYPGFGVVAGYVDPAEQPALFYSAQPLSRNRVTVLLRLVLIALALPFVVPTAMVLIALLFAAWWVVLVLGRWPDVLRRNVAGCFRYLLRFAAYAWLIVDEYPPVIPDLEPVTGEDAPTFMRIRPDPREVTGPPWPRLVGGETYQPPALLRWPILIGVVVLTSSVLAPLGRLTNIRPGPSPTAQATSPASTSAPVPPPPAASPSPPATGLSPSASRPIIADLEQRVLPPPAGYFAGEGLAYPDVPPATFEQRAGARSAAEAGYLGGYEATYYNDTPELNIDVVLLRFSSPQDAVRFASSASIIPEGESPARSAFAAIPGAIAVNPTDASSWSCCDHAVAATRGSRVMLVDFSGSHAGPPPADLAVWAEQQYARL